MCILVSVSTANAGRGYGFPVTYVIIVANSIGTLTTMIGMFVYDTRPDRIFLPLFIASLVHVLLGSFGVFVFQFLPVYYAVRVLKCRDGGDHTSSLSLSQIGNPNKP